MALASFSCYWRSSIDSGWHMPCLLSWQHFFQWGLSITSRTLKDHQDRKSKPDDSTPLMNTWVAHCQHPAGHGTTRKVALVHDAVAHMAVIITHPGLSNIAHVVAGYHTNCARVLGSSLSVRPVGYSHIDHPLVITHINHRWNLRALTPFKTDSSPSYLLSGHQNFCVPQLSHERRWKHQGSPATISPRSGWRPCTWFSPRICECPGQRSSQPAAAASSSLLSSPARWTNEVGRCSQPKIHWRLTKVERPKWPYWIPVCISPVRLWKLFVVMIDLSWPPSPTRVWSQARARDYKVCCKYPLQTTSRPYKMTRLFDHPSQNWQKTLSEKTNVILQASVLGNHVSSCAIHFFPTSFHPTVGLYNILSNHVGLQMISRYSGVIERRAYKMIAWSAGILVFCPPPPKKIQKWYQNTKRWGL